MNEIEKMMSEIQKMAGDLGCGPIQFEADAELNNYKKGKPMTFGELRAIANAKGVVWLKCTENEQDRGSSAQNASITKHGDFFFDDGSSWATDMEEQKKPDSELAVEYCDDWIKAVFHAIKTKAKGTKNGKIRNKTTR